MSITLQILDREEYFVLRDYRNSLRDKHDSLTGREAGQMSKEIKEIDKTLELHEWSNPEDQDLYTVWVKNNYGKKEGK